MLKLLIANDDKEILQDIIDIIRLKYDMDSIDIIKSESYQETLYNLHTKKIDKLILDITMPTYTINSHEPGGSTRKTAGVDILYRIQLYNINVSVVLLTRLGTFFTGKDDIDYDFETIDRFTREGKWPSCKKILKHSYIDLNWQEELYNYLGE